MFLFRDPVTLLQAFGYSIALGGLIYYKLGGEKLKEAISAGGMKWAEFGQNRPATRKLIVFAGVIASMFMILSSLGPRYAPEQTGKLYNGVQSGIGHVLGEKSLAHKSDVEDLSSISGYTSSMFFYPVFGVGLGRFGGSGV
jgi:hypothetical protein